MAVEARHLNLFPSQLITKRNFFSANDGLANMLNAQMDSVVPVAQTMPDALLSFYQSATASMKADSGLTYNFPVPRKRTRDSMNQLEPLTASPKTNLSQFLSFLGEDISLQIQQQQLDIDRCIAEHTDKVRLELMERRKRYSGFLAAAIEDGMTKKLKEKDEEVERMGKLNLILQERVRTLCVENQIWRELAQANEATANSLRSNLEQVLAHVSEERLSEGGGAAAEDCVSSCGSNDGVREKRARVAATAAWEESGSASVKMLCRKCGERESCVLLLPCRHLCICTMCGSSLHICPVCNANVNASVRVNMS